MQNNNSMIILDTHAWIWWSNESTKLAPRAKKIIQEADLVGVTAISCWELARILLYRKISTHVFEFDIIIGWTSKLYI